MGYAEARFEAENRLETWKMYVADGLYAVSNGISAIAGGPRLIRQYGEVKTEPEKTGDEILKDLVNNGALVVT